MPTILFHDGVKIYCADVTPGSSFGYDLAIKAGNADSPLFARSVEVWATEGQWGQFSPRFRAGDILDAIQAARAWIDAHTPAPQSPQTLPALSAGGFSQI